VGPRLPRTVSDHVKPMRLISWQRLGVIASVVWVVVGPSYFHLSLEDNDKGIAGGRYQLCINQNWARKEGVEGCNKELRQALTIAHWSSWAELAFIPVGLAWVLGWALLFLVKRVKSRPQADNEHYPQIANSADNADNDEQHGKKDYFPAPWTVEPIEGGFKVIDSNGQTLAYVYGHADPRDAGITKALTSMRPGASLPTSPSCRRCSLRRARLIEEWSR
jgi:hypothetical protein